MNVNSQALDRLTIGDDGFLIASIIERCPRVMMLRELLKNAEEAASQDAGGDCRVEITAVPVADVRKLAIWNTGPGLSAEELFEMCNIASSIRKEKGLDRNFGMGAKVASLPSNQFGMRYWSSKNGRVNQVMLGKRDGVYGRVTVSGTSGSVINVTEEAVAAGFDISREWTQVVLLGNRWDQDTVSQPYGNNPAVGENWIPSYIYTRFFRVNSGVRILLGPSIHNQSGLRDMQFRSVRLPKHFGRYDKVTTPEGIAIHYAYNPDEATLQAALFRGGLVADEACGALVFGDESYDPRRGDQWLLEAPSFGIPYAARHISVHVELPGDAAVRPDAYRQFLRYVSGAQEHVRLLDFAQLVYDHRPAWLLDLMRQLLPDSDFIRDISEQLEAIIRDIGLKRRQHAARLGVVKAIPAPEPRPPATAEATDPKDSAPTNAPMPPPPSGKGGPNDPLVEDYELAPEIHILRRPQEIADRGLQHRAARYYIASHQLFINAQYPAIGRLAGALVAGTGQAGDLTLVRATAVELAERLLVLRVGRALVFGLAKQSRKEGWSAMERNFVLSSECLTIAADDLEGAGSSLRQEFARRLDMLLAPVAG